MVQYFLSIIFFKLLKTFLKYILDTEHFFNFCFDIVRGGVREWLPYPVGFQTQLNSILLSSTSTYISTIHLFHINLLALECFNFLSFWAAFRSFSCSGGVSSVTDTAPRYFLLLLSLLSIALRQNLYLTLTQACFLTLSASGVPPACSGFRSLLSGVVSFLTSSFFAEGVASAFGRLGRLSGFSLTGSKGVGGAKTSSSSFLLSLVWNNLKIRIWTRSKFSF